MALVALWAIVMNAWLIEGNAATTAMIGWAVLLVLFIATTRSTNPWLHAGAAAFARVVHQRDCARARPGRAVAVDRLS